MKYDEALRFVFSLVNYERHSPAAGTMRREVTLERVKELAGALGNPERGLACVHVAGTKGKGSTCAFAEAILREHGLKTGLYTSPHLVDIRERIQIAGRPIDKRLFARIVARLVPFIEERRRGGEATSLGPDRRATYFETLTHLAFIAFKEMEVEAAVVEVGMGGRLDATNIVVPKVSVITPIGMDHTEQLGDTIPRIAWEKAGIIKPGVPVVVNPGPDEAAETIERVAAERSAPLHLLGRDFVTHDAAGGSLTVELIRLHERIDGLRPSLFGSHQRSNAATAVAASAVFLQSMGRPLDHDAVRRAVANTNWPGRLQRVADNPPTYIDGAHNVQSIEVLFQALRDQHPGKPIVAAFGCAADKDIPGMLSVLRREAAAVVFTRSAIPRAAAPDELREWFVLDPSPLSITAGTSAEAYRKVREIAAALSAVAVITGSLYIVGEVLSMLSTRP